MFDRFFMSNSTYSLYQYLLMNKGNVDKTLFVLGPAVADADVTHKITFTLPSDSEHPAFARQLQSKIARALNGRAAQGYVNLSTPQAARVCAPWPVSALSDGLSDLTLFPKYLKDPAVKHCYATATAAAPDKTDKLSIIDLKKEWRALSSAEKARVAAVFGIDAKELELLKQKKVILITQPLSEDGIVSETDKQRLYQKILSAYNPDDVVIKPHPREKTNWGAVFPNTPIISRRVPAELLSDMIDLKKVCTFFSTAAFGMTAPENVDIYAKDFGKLTFSHPGEKMGNMPYVDIEQAYGHMPFNWKRIPDAFFYRVSENQRPTRFIDNGRG